MTDNKTIKTIHVVYSSVGEDEDFERWIIAIYKEKRLADRHRELAEKYLKEVDKIAHIFSGDEEDEPPNEIPFDEFFFSAHYHLYENYPMLPSQLITYWQAEEKISTEEDLLKAIGQSWKDEPRSKEQHAT